jgi:hypothetical protein
MRQFKFPQRANKRTLRLQLVSWSEQSFTLQAPKSRARRHRSTDRSYRHTVQAGRACLLPPVKPDSGKIIVKVVQARYLDAGDEQRSERRKTRRQMNEDRWVLPQRLHQRHAIQMAPRSELGGAKAELVPEGARKGF